MHNPEMGLRNQNLGGGGGRFAVNFLSYYIVARYFLCSLKFTIYYKKLWYNNDTTGGMNLHNNPVAIRNYLKVCSKNNARQATQGG